MTGENNIAISVLKDIATYKDYNHVSQCINDEEDMIFIEGVIDEQSIMRDGLSDISIADWKKDQVNKVFDMDGKKTCDVSESNENETDICDVALGCKKRGVMPYWLTKAVAFSYLNISVSFTQDGLKKKIRDDNNILALEPEIVQLIVDRYFEAKDSSSDSISELNSYVMLLKKS